MPVQMSVLQQLGCPFRRYHEVNVCWCDCGMCVCVCVCLYWLMPSRAAAWLKHLLTIKLSCAWWSRRVILCITPVPLPPHADTQSNRKMGIFVFLALRGLVRWAVFLCSSVCVGCIFVWVGEGQKERTREKANRPDKFKATMADFLAVKKENLEKQQNIWHRGTIGHQHTQPNNMM